MKLLLILLIAVLSLPGRAQVYELMDLQMHMTMHYAYPFFSSGLQDGPLERIDRLTNRHLLKNVIYKNLLTKNKGVRILSNGAIAFEYARNKEKIKASILQQIEAVNEMVAENSEDFAVARSAAEVRGLVKMTAKTIIIHSIEGGTNLIDSQEDADFWKQQGVAFITLIHLVDNSYGGAAVQEGPLMLLNPRGAWRRHRRSKHRGLTEKGKNAIRFLAKAGIMTDLSHMSQDAVDDALEVFAELKLPPLVTHSSFFPITKKDFSITRDQLFKIYALGGLYSLPIAGESSIPRQADADFVTYTDGQKICSGSIDSYRVAYSFIESLLWNGRTAPQLTEEERRNLAVGWQSDFNGWLNHSRPRFGKKGCYRIPKDRALPSIEVRGLAHPGLLEEHWRILAAEGMNVDSLRFATEKFLTMWERFQ